MTLGWCSHLRLPQVFTIAFMVLAGVVVVLLPTGYFGPLSSRIRGLFVKHTKTGVMPLIPHSCHWHPPVVNS